MMPELLVAPAARRSLRDRRSSASPPIPQQSGPGREARFWYITRKTLRFTRAENGACRRSQRRILATFGTTTPCEALRRPHGAPARRSAAFHVTLAALDPPRAST